MKKIIRNRSDEAGRAFWESAEVSAQGVRDWPDWKKAGVTVEQPGVETQVTVDVVDVRTLGSAASTEAGG